MKKKNNENIQKKFSWSGVAPLGIWIWLCVFSNPGYEAVFFTFSAIHDTAYFQVQYGVQQNFPNIVVFSYKAEMTNNLK